MNTIDVLLIVVVILGTGILAMLIVLLRHQSAMEEALEQVRRALQRIDPHDMGLPK